MKRSVFYGYGFVPQASLYSELFRQVVEGSEDERVTRA
jgi:hypothetical protein